MAFFDVGAKKGEHCTEQVFVGLEDLLLGREGSRERGRRFEDHLRRTFFSPSDKARQGYTPVLSFQCAF